MIRLKLLFLSIVLCVATQTYAQKLKILFDASKGETANNADWVIDSDNFNLKVSKGKASVGGSESNPQQIPTPAQSGITATTAGTFWKGALSSWGVDCVKQGYQVETLPYNGKITYGDATNAQDLSNYKVYIVCEPNFAFTATEKVAMLNFVQNGGGLFMVSDHDVSDRDNDGVDSPHAWNDFLSNNTVKNNPFGITFDYANLVQPSTNIAPLAKDSVLHGVMGDVEEVAWFNGTTMTLSPTVNPSVVGQVRTTGTAATSNANVMFATARYGKGKVAAIGDSSPCDDGSGDSGDSLYDGYVKDANGNHQVLLMNATIWLATPNKVSTDILNTEDEKIDFRIFPNPVVDGNFQMSYFLRNAANTKVQVLDVTGAVVRTVTFPNDCTGAHLVTIDVAGLRTGLYLCRIATETGSATQTIIVSPRK